jgi:hypothetical protein
MILNRTKTIMTRWWITVIACSAFAASAPAQPARTASIDGVYNGSYAGGQAAPVRGEVAKASVRPIKFKLSITQQDNGVLTGVFTLYLPEDSDTKAYTCTLTGYFHANRTFLLNRGKWETPPPSGFEMTAGMNGLFDPNGGNGAGQVSGKIRDGSWPKFEAIRDVAESAKMASATADTKAVAPPATPVAPPTRRPMAAKPAAPPPPSSSASVPDASGPIAINGVYTGEFHRSDGDVKLKFSIKSTDDGSLTGLFTFELPHKPGSFITYKLTGRYDAGAHDQWGNRLDPFQFTTIEPVGSAAQDALNASKAQAARVGIIGPGSINGSLTGFRPEGGEFICSRFNATKDRTESADLDKVMAAQASAGSTAAAAVAPVVRSSFDGVYNGTFADKQGPIRFKLTLWTKQENRGAGGVLINSTPAGVLTFYLSEGSGTNAYTCELTGFYLPTNGFQPDRIQLLRTKWETKPPRGLLFGGLDGAVFDPHGGNGAGQISGYFSAGKYQALRDAAESAKVASAELSNKRQPSIAGVFNGTYTREKEPPTKFKLTMTYPSGGGGGGSADLAGVATIYLPTGSGTKAYTYGLIGAEEGYGDFELKVNDWETIPPKDFKNFKAMGFNGRFVPDMTQNTARIISVPYDVTIFVPQFEATWDATESADIKGAIAAQEAVGDADQVAALKAHAEVVKNAQPKQLASKDLVRKSQAYWDGYRGDDFIREVFDGGFASDVDDDPDFKFMFVRYVDLFSENCSAYLPADHKTITITTTTTRNGAVIGTTSKTVEMDSRFIAKYVEYSDVPAAPGSDQEQEETAKTIAIAGQIFHAGGPSHGTSPADANALLHLVAAHGLAGGSGMDKFFATELKATGPSAALRQMGENLLRGATGEPSLQEAGAKIAGAEAETDKNLPPGRFARLIDAAHAFYREPAHARLESRFETAFDETLAAKYRGVMTRDEEYYYANDFENRFRGQIMQPRAYCKDPEWPRLHPAVEECIAELQ